MTDSTLLLDGVAVRTRASSRNVVGFGVCTMLLCVMGLNPSRSTLSGGVGCTIKGYPILTRAPSGFAGLLGGMLGDRTLLIK